jgi:hypothetical protein
LIHLSSPPTCAKISGNVAHYSTLAVTDSGTKCGCNRSFGVICAIFVGIGVALLLAERRCLDSGGRVSDTAWSCEAAPGAVSSLWVLVTPGIVTVAVLVGVAVYFAVSAFARRWFFKYGKHHG